jgi:hypothetical protein
MATKKPALELASTRLTFSQYSRSTPLVKPGPSRGARAVAGAPTALGVQ